MNYLGNPDNGTILAAYVGSLLLAGGFLAVGSCMSALTRNQVVAFILGVVVCFAFIVLVKFVQLYFPPRTVTLNYVVAQSLGQCQRIDHGAAGSLGKGRRHCMRRIANA